MRNMKNAAPLLMLLVSGCATVGTAGTPVNETSLVGFQRGVTTKAQVIAALGQPEASSINEDRSTLLHYKSTSFKSNGMSLVPLTGPFADRDQEHKQACDLGFDQYDLFTGGTCSDQTIINNGLLHGGVQTVSPQ